MSRRGDKKSDFEIDFPAKKRIRSVNHYLLGDFGMCFQPRCHLFLLIGHFEISNIQLDSEAVRTKTIETRWNECEKYLHIILFPLSLSSLSR